MSLQLGYRAFTVTYTAQEAAGTLTDRVIFVAPFDCVLNGVNEAHTALGTDASAVSLQLEKLVDGQALGAGQVILSNNTNAGFNLKGTVNTNQKGTFKTGVAGNSIRRFKRGDRVALKKAGVTTAVAGVSVSLSFNRK